MRYRLLTAAFAATAALNIAGPVQAAELEVTHWWTSGGEAAAVAEFAKAFDASGHKWIDGAIAGSGGTARPIMISRITGGDPMVVPDRVCETIRVLKAEFGPDFHIHLYTSCAFDTTEIQRLKDAGLDEIRFHPELREYKDMENGWHHAAIQEALRVGLTTNVEIPAVPGKEEDILALCHYLESVGAAGINMNELEFSDPNIANLKRFGYQPMNDESQCVAGSRETALAVLDAWRDRRKETGSSFTVHFCSSPYKDAIQLMQRLRRRAERTARPFEEQSEEGTLLFGIIRPADGRPGELAERLRADYEVPPELILVEGDHVETDPAIAQVLAEEGILEELGCAAWISEVYPTADRLEVERVPLSSFSEAED